MPKKKLKSIIYGVGLFLIFLTVQSRSEFRVDIGNKDVSSWWGGHVILKDNKLFKIKDHAGKPLENISETVNLDDVGKIIFYAPPSSPSSKLLKTVHSPLHGIIL